MLYMRVMYVERAGCWLFGGGVVSRDLVPEVAQGGHPVNPCLPFPLLGVAEGGAGTYDFKSHFVT